MEETNTTDISLIYMASEYADSQAVNQSHCVTQNHSMLIISGVCIGICMCGLVGNVVVVWFLGFQMKKSPFTVYVLNLAIADFSLLLFLLVKLTLHFISAVYCIFSIQYRLTNYILMDLFLFWYFASMYLLTAMSLERCLSVLFPIWYRIHRPQHLSAVVCALLWALSIAVIAAVTSLCLSQEHQHCQIALISMYGLNFLIFAPPMVISSTIVFIKAQCGSQQHQPKRLYIVIFLSVLFFLLFALPLSIWNFLQQFGHSVVSSQVVFLLACINSSTNPFIYFLVGSCWRHCSLVSPQVAFRRVFEEPEDNTTSGASRRSMWGGMLRGERVGARLSSSLPAHPTS
uniref:G-protein coupled receptors family 1 profile domain-containing protein n=1 Tax=Bubo bubo TaxID=30461 RepID=A0A8C0FV59_BUBBB